MSVDPHLEAPGRTSIGRSKRKVAIMTMLMLAGYVLLYPVCAILAYFNYISSDHGIGRVLEVLFIPLGHLEKHSEVVRAFFKWLIDFFTAPFF